jgi:hypothetical protein
MTTAMQRGAVALGMAGALTLAAAAPSFAAPVLSSTTALTSAAPSQVTDVRWRGGGVAAAGVGFAAGAAVGAAAANAAAPGYSGYYGDPGYAYGYDAAYDDQAYPAYGYAPTYNWGGGTSYTYAEPAYGAPPAYAAEPYVGTTRTYAAAPAATDRGWNGDSWNRGANRDAAATTGRATSRTAPANAYGSDAPRARTAARDGAGTDQCWIVTGGDNNHGYAGDCKAKGAMPHEYHRQ